jgi:hypothetical protein
MPNLAVTPRLPLFTLQHNPASHTMTAKQTVSSALRGPVIGLGIRAHPTISLSAASLEVSRRLFPSSLDAGTKRGGEKLDYSE